MTREGTIKMKLCLDYCFADLNTMHSYVLYTRCEVM